MYLVRRNNSQNALGLNHIFDRFFNDFVNDYEQDSVTWAPRIDVHESTDAYEVLADMPGLDKKDIEVSLENNVLTLKGERKSENSKEDKNYHYSERAHGAFCRSFSLPERVNEGAIKAEYKDGVLRLTLPKSEEAKPKQISIQ
jgi:HSP20 family protein